MSLIFHNFNSIEISQRINDGYINLTQMAKATKARLDDWKENKETTALFREFSESPAYQGLQPILSVQGRNGGTWAHPDIAIAFAQWSSPAFALQVSRWVREWMISGKNPVSATSPQLLLALSQPTDAIALTSNILKQAGINDPLVGSWALGQYAKYDPENAAIYEDGKRLLSGQMTVPETPVSPTELGKAIAQQMGWVKVPSARIVNQALINAGLQVAEKFIDKHDKPKINYHLTEMGKQYGEIVMDTARGHGKTVFHPRWFSSVIPVVVEHLQAE